MANHKLKMGEVGTFLSLTDAYRKLLVSPSSHLHLPAFVVKAWFPKDRLLFDTVCSQAQAGKTIRGFLKGHENFILSVSVIRTKRDAIRMVGCGAAKEK
jgi:hypothetical protein